MEVVNIWPDSFKSIGSLFDLIGDIDDVNRSRLQSFANMLRICYDITTIFSARMNCNWGIASSRASASFIVAWFHSRRWVVK